MRLANTKMTRRTRTRAFVVFRLAVPPLGLGSTRASWTTRTRIHPGLYRRRHTEMSQRRKRRHGGALRARMRAGAETGAGNTRRRHGSALRSLLIPPQRGTVLNMNNVYVDAEIFHSY